MAATRATLAMATKDTKERVAELEKYEEDEVEGPIVATKAVDEGKTKVVLGRGGVQVAIVQPSGPQPRPVRQIIFRPDRLGLLAFPLSLVTVLPVLLFFSWPFCAQWSIFYNSPMTAGIFS